MTAICRISPKFNRGVLFLFCRSCISESKCVLQRTCALDVRPTSYAQCPLGNLWSSRDVAVVVCILPDSQTIPPWLVRLLRNAIFLCHCILAAIDIGAPIVLKAPDKPISTGSSGGPANLPLPINVATTCTTVSHTQKPNTMATQAFSQIPVM